MLVAAIVSACFTASIAFATYLYRRDTSRLWKVTKDAFLLNWLMSVAQFVVSAEQLRSQGRDLKKMIEETNEWLDIMRKIFPEMSPELKECLHRMDRRLEKKEEATS
jgi:hypothetical protein